MKMSKVDFNKCFNAFILVGMTLVMVAATLLKLQNAQTGQAMLIVAAFGSLMGVLSTVCSANAKILTFLFGLFDVSIYGVMCFVGGKYGNAALHILYFLPMQFIGFFQWKKRGAVSGESVRARRLNGRQWALYGAIFLAGLGVSYLVLLRVGSPEAQQVLKLAILMDALSMMCNILGQMLMSMAFMEQWFFWIGVNIASVVMWAVTLSHSSDSYALIYLIKYSFYLLNSLNGLRIWFNLSRPGSAPGIRKTTDLEE